MEEIISVLMIFSIYGIMFLFLGAYLLAIYLLKAIPLYKIGKKLGYDKNFLPWLGGYFATYALSDMPGIKEFSITPKIDSFLKIRTKNRAFIIFLAVNIIFPLLPFVFIFGFFLLFFLSALLPEAVFVVFAVILMLLYLLFFALYSILSYAVTAVYAVVHYVYLRDLSCIFIPDRNTAKTLSVLSAVLDSFTGGFAIPVYLCCLSRKDPLPEEPTEPFSENTASYFKE